MNSFAADVGRGDFGWQLMSGCHPLSWSLMSGDLGVFHAGAGVAGAALMGRLPATLGTHMKELDELSLLQAHLQQYCRVRRGASPSRSVARCVLRGLSGECIVLGSRATDLEQVVGDTPMRRIP